MTAANGVSKTLRILMLHGYTQSGPLFNAKTKALEKNLNKAFPGVVLNYPTGPMKLRAKDVPGFDTSQVEDDAEEVEAYGWWRRSNTADPPEYVGFDEGLGLIAELLKTQGPFDGVIGFSQGAAMAAMVSSLLEGESRKSAFEAAQQNNKSAIPFPASFAGLNHPPMKFCVLYAGFIAPGARYTAFYEPPLATPTCHFIGSLDTVVEEDRANTLIDATGGQQKTTVMIHPGGHFVPSSRQYIDAVIGFIKTKLADAANSINHEESVEDMDVPF